MYTPLFKVETCPPWEVLQKLWADSCPRQADAIPKQPHERAKEACRASCANECAEYVSEFWTPRAEEAEHVESEVDGEGHFGCRKEEAPECVYFATCRFTAVDELSRSNQHTSLSAY